MRAAGLQFDVVVTDVDESIRNNETPREYVRRLAAEKSAEAMRLSRERGGDAVVIVGADTSVVLGGAILGKPVDDRDAAAMLRRLSGQRHEVLTGISVRRGAIELGSVEATTVEFSVLSEADIAWYVASGEGRDKAGGYAIQGLASRFIPRIDGSYSNVVGLPVAALYHLIRQIADC